MPLCSASALMQQYPAPFRNTFQTFCFLAPKPWERRRPKRDFCRRQTWAWSCCSLCGFIFLPQTDVDFFNWFVSFSRSSVLSFPIIFIQSLFPILHENIFANHDLRIMRHGDVETAPCPGHQEIVPNHLGPELTEFVLRLYFNMSLMCQTWRHHETLIDSCFHFFESLNLKRKHILSIGIQKALLVLPTNLSIPTSFSFEDIPRVEFEAGDAPSQKAGSFAASLMHLILQGTGYPFSAGSLEGWCGPVWRVGATWHKVFPWRSQRHFFVAQGPGGHNVIAGIFDGIKAWNEDSVMTLWHWTVWYPSPLLTFTFKSCNTSFVCSWGCVRFFWGFD